MSPTFSVGIAELRKGARTLRGAEGAPATVTIGLGDLGSRRVDAAFERYHPTWTSECSAAVRGIEKLSAILTSSADTYEQRDADAAQTFGGGARAFWDDGLVAGPVR